MLLYYIVLLRRWRDMAHARSLSNVYARCTTAATTPPGCAGGASWIICAARGVDGDDGGVRLCGSGYILLLFFLYFVVQATADGSRI